MTRWRLLGVPLDSSGRGRGEGRAPAALRQAGIVERLGVEDGGDVAVGLSDPVRDPETGIVGYAELRAASAAIRDAVAGILADDELPLVVGGDCSLLPGVAAGFTRASPSTGVLYLDGHTDLYEPHRSATGEAADMPLALMCGIGPSGLTRLGERFPLVDPGRVALVGNRDHDEWRGLGVTPPGELVPAMQIVDAATLLSRSPDAVGRRLVASLEEAADSLWIHLDLDVLDENVLPAVTYAQPGGLSWSDVAAVVKPALRSRKLVGMDVTDLNPDRVTGPADTTRVVASLERMLADGRGR